VPPSVGWYRGCGFDYRWYRDTATATWMHVHNFLDKTWHLHPTKICVCWIEHEASVIGALWDSIWRPTDMESYREYHWAILYILTQIPFRVSTMNLGYLYPQRIIDQNDSFRYFRLLMSIWRDPICENTFETSHVRFIHENFSVLITTPLDQIQQNLFRKENCQTTVKPADIVLETWFEEYPTPPEPSYKIWDI